MGLSGLGVGVCIRTQHGTGFFGGLSMVDLFLKGALLGERGSLQYVGAMWMVS